MSDVDPMAGLKRLAAYIILGVWAITFVGSLFTEVDSAQMLGIQAVMMVVAGALFADQYRGGPPAGPPPNQGGNG